MRYEVETIFQTHSECYNTRSKKQAFKYFEELKNKITNDSEIENISLNSMTLKDDELIKKTIEKVERGTDND